MVRPGRPVPDARRLPLVLGSCDDAIQVVRFRSRADAELAEISPEGRLAGRTVSLLLIGSAAAVIAVSWNELWHRCGAVDGRCVERAAGAGILTIFSLFVLAGGIGIWRQVRRRPLDPDGSSRYVWALGLLFALGLALVAARIPAFTCVRGRFDDVLRLCMHPPSTSVPASRLLVKRAVLVVGLLGGVVIAAKPRGVRLWVPVTVAAWVAGAGWSMVHAWVLSSD
jgi:hypothetical protein